MSDETLDDLLDLPVDETVEGRFDGLGPAHGGLEDLAAAERSIGDACGELRRVCSKQ